MMFFFFWKNKSVKVFSTGTSSQPVSFFLLSFPGRERKTSDEIDAHAPMVENHRIVFLARFDSLDYGFQRTKKFNYRVPKKYLFISICFF
jgi:hypothetical protein